MLALLVLFVGGIGAFCGSLALDVNLTPLWLLLAVGMIMFVFAPLR